ncbi:MAG: hypothetical protein KBC57_12550 [Neisseriaceae bacterium]|nr:hypothetical protein [Neisseriaceae bacterium]
MQLSNPKQVLNLDDFLPSDGEDRIEMYFMDGDLSLDILYEIEDSEPRSAKCRVHFYYAKYFFKTPFPGYSFFSCPDDRKLSLLNSLVEYEHSDMVEMDGVTSRTKGYKHYRLFLHTTGVAIHVVAESCKISNEELIG